MLITLLAGCARPDGPTKTMMSHAELLDNAILTPDGVRLPLRTWLPEGDPKGVILYVHGFNDYGNAIARPAPVFTRNGYAVFAYDQRGFGAAPDPGQWPGEAAMTGDLVTAARLIGARFAGKPLYLIGESMGGAVAMRALAMPDAPKVAGTILVAPAVWSRQRMNLFERVGLWIGAHALPWLPVNGNGLDIWPSDNIEMLREMSRDPLVIKDTRIDAIEGLVDLMDAAYSGAASLPGPALYLYGEHDQIVPAPPTYDVMERLDGRPGITLAVYPKGYHMLLRDLDADTILGDIVAWMGHPEAPLPSGADRRALEVLGEHRAKSLAAAK
jgi:alpha-beta hydrolase superfamily lysophospholipase